MESLVLALLRSHQPVRGLDIDERRAVVHLSAGNFVVRLPVPVPRQWREAETAAAGGGLQLVAVVPVDGQRMVFGFRADGVPIMTVAWAPA